MVHSDKSGSNKSGDEASKVLRKFRLVFNAVKTHFQQIERKVGIGGAQVWALSVIDRSPGLGVTALAQAMDIHQTTASNLIKSLVSAELIVVEKDSRDRRSVQLFIKAAGKNILKKVPGPFEGILPNALGQLDEHTLARLNADLGALLLLIEADEAAAQIPLAQV